MYIYIYIYISKCYRKTATVLTSASFLSPKSFQNPSQEVPKSFKNHPKRVLGGPRGLLEPGSILEVENPPKSKDRLRLWAPKFEVFAMLARSHEGTRWCRKGRGSWPLRNIKPTHPDDHRTSLLALGTLP